MNTAEYKTFFLIGIIIGAIVGSIYGVMISCISLDDSINLNPVKDKHRNEILYYIDTNTNKTYKFSGDVLYNLED